MATVLPPQEFARNVPPTNNQSTALVRLALLELSPKLDQPHAQLVPTTVLLVTLPLTALLVMLDLNSQPVEALKCVQLVLLDSSHPLTEPSVLPALMDVLTALMSTLPFVPNVCPCGSSTPTRLPAKSALMEPSPFPETLNVLLVPTVA